MKGLTHFFILTIMTLTAYSQNKDRVDYSTIPDYPEAYNAGTVTARLLDALGFRYYWATDGLRSEDLDYRPSEEARASEETLDHILGLSQIIVNTSLKKIHESVDLEGLTFEEKRNITLNNIRTAADIFRAASNSEMQEFEILFQRQNGAVNYPLWNLINGPIADAIWHVGQVVSFRRSSGNPFNSKVSVFTGKVRD